MSESGRDSVRLDLVDEPGTAFATQAVINTVRSAAPPRGAAALTLSRICSNPSSPATTILCTPGAQAP